MIARAQPTQTQLSLLSAVSKAPGDVECQVIWNDADDLSRSDAGKHAFQRQQQKQLGERSDEGVSYRDKWSLDSVCDGTLAQPFTAARWLCQHQTKARL